MAGKSSWACIFNGDVFNQLRCVWNLAKLVGIYNSSLHGSSDQRPAKKREKYIAQKLN